MPTTLSTEDQLRRARVVFARELDRYSIRVLLYVRGTGERPTRSDMDAFWLSAVTYSRILNEAVEARDA